MLQLLGLELVEDLLFFFLFVLIKADFLFEGILGIFHEDGFYLSLYVQYCLMLSRSMSSRIEVRVSVSSFELLAWLWYLTSPKATSVRLLMFLMVSRA